MAAGTSPAASATPSATPQTPPAGDSRPESYTVKPGDTLYSIALEHGLDYRELAIWNGIDNPGALRVGQQLRVVPPAGGAIAAPLKGPPGAVEAKPLGPGTGPSAAPPAIPTPSGGLTVTEPKAMRLPYSEQAYAQLSKAEPAPSAPQADAPRAAPQPDTKSPSGSDAARGPEELEWTWPVKGKVITTFSENTNKGIAIAGKMGQPVLASAPGRVIFSGMGIRGFGKLIVIKHNNTYLSVYAHNSELLVKEGQNVTRGQKIAEMGNTDSDQVQLHFEIRRFGKPVDPLKLLPAG